MSGRCRNFAIWAIGAVPVLGLLTLFGCGHSPSSGPSAGSTSGAGAITTVRPTPHTITRLIQLPGYINSYEQTPIYAKIAGFVEEMKVDKGSVVHKGDLLLKMWVPELMQDLTAKQERVVQAGAEIKQAEASLEAADANINTSTAIVNEAKANVNEASAIYRRWQAEYDRATKLLGSGIYDKQTQEEMRSQMEQSTAGIAKANAKLASAEAFLIESKAKREKAAADVTAAKAKLQVTEAEKSVAAAWLDYRNILAPFDGVVTMRNVNTGAFLQSSSSGSTNKAAEPLFVVMRSDIMRITMQVPEYDAMFVKLGMPAVVRFEKALPGQEFKGKVSLTTWAIDQQSRTLHVEIFLDNPGGEKLRPGMFATITLAAEIPNALTIPSDALMADSDGGAKMFCYIVDSGKAVRTAVEVGVRTDKLTQVLQKQQKGKWVNFTGQEEIVARNPESLIDGQEVSTSRVELERILDESQSP